MAHFWPVLLSDPVASTICNNTSALLRSLRNLFPKPFPLCASGTKPATSNKFIGIKRFPSTQNEFFGLSSTFNSLQTHLVFTYAIPLLASIVVNGISLTFACVKQAAFKKVDLPELSLQIPKSYLNLAFRQFQKFES